MSRDFWTWRPTEKQQELFNEWQQFTVGYLISSKEGVNIRSIRKNLEEHTGESIPLEKMGFRTINQFLHEMSNFVDFRTRDGQYYAFIRECAVPATMEHIRKEVLGQAKDKGCKSKSGKITRPTRAQSFFVSPQVILDAVESILRIPEDKYEHRPPPPVTNRPKGRPRRRTAGSGPPRSIFSRPSTAVPCSRSSLPPRTLGSSLPPRPSPAPKPSASNQNRPVTRPIMSSPNASKPSAPGIRSDVKTRLQLAVMEIQRQAAARQNQAGKENRSVAESSSSSASRNELPSTDPPKPQVTPRSLAVANPPRPMATVFGTSDESGLSSDEVDCFFASPAKPPTTVRNVAVNDEVDSLCERIKVTILNTNSGPSVPKNTPVSQKLPPNPEPRPACQIRDNIMSKLQGPLSGTPSRSPAKAMPTQNRTITAVPMEERIPVPNRTAPVTVNMDEVANFPGSARDREMMQLISGGNIINGVPEFLTGGTYMKNYALKRYFQSPFI